MSSFERQSEFGREQQSPHLPPLELFEIAATIPRGEPETFGATPLDHGAAFGQQQDLQERLQSLVDRDIPSNIPENIVDYMKDTFVARFYRRGTANYENYLSSLHSCEDYNGSPIASDVLSRAKLGHASPAELLLVRQMLGIRSAELACLTHSYGKRLEHIEVMRAAVRQSVELLGGTYDDEPDTRYRVKEIVHWDLSQGFFMTRKRTLGRMPDGTVIRERTSFILRSDEEGAVPRQNLIAINNCPNQPSWQDAVVRVGYLDAIADGLLEANAFSLAIPVSTTIYAFNPITADLIKQRQKAINKQRRRESATDFEQYPELLEHRRLYGPSQDLGEMLYIGHEDTDD